MAERSHEPVELDGDVPRPPVVYYIAGVAGFLALAGSVPVTTMVRDFPLVQRLVFGGPLLVLGLVCWAFATMRFAEYAVAVRRAREAQATPVDDREAEDLVLLHQASHVLLPPPAIVAEQAEGEERIGQRTPRRRRATRRPLVAADVD